MTYPPADVGRLNVIARELYELMRLSNTACPAWEELNPANAVHAELIRMARETAREFMQAEQDGATAPPTLSTPQSTAS